MVFGKVMIMVIGGMMAVCAHGREHCTQQGLTDVTEAITHLWQFKKGFLVKGYNRTPSNVFTLKATACKNNGHCEEIYSRCSADGLRVLTESEYQRFTKDHEYLNNKAWGCYLRGAKVNDDQLFPASLQLIDKGLRSKSVSDLHDINIVGTGDFLATSRGAKQEFLVISTCADGFFEILLFK